MTQLHIKDIKPDFNFPVNKDIGLSRIKYITERTIDYDVFLSSKGCNLQRPFVWTLLQKQQLILSIFKENFIPKMSIIESYDDDNNLTYQIIDGKQRLYRDLV